MEIIFQLPSASIATRQAARCCSDNASVVATGVVTAGVVGAGVVAAGVVSAGVVSAGIAMPSVAGSVVSTGVVSVAVPSVASVIGWMVPVNGALIVDDSSLAEVTKMSKDVESLLSVPTVVNTAGELKASGPSSPIIVSVTSVGAPVVTIIPESSTGDSPSVMVTPVESPLTVVMSGPAVTGPAAADVEH